MGYCNITDIRDITNITSSDLSDSEITALIGKATRELNSKINVRVIREEIEYLDTTRTNYIDGSNKTYYIRNWQDRFLADMNNDGTVTVSDIIVYAVFSDGTETLPTISSIDYTKGSFTLSTAYSSSYRLYATYEWCYRNAGESDTLINLACTFLTSAYAYAKINIGREPQVSYGNIRIYRHMDAFREYYDKAMDVINDINYKMSVIKDVRN